MCHVFLVLYLEGTLPLFVFASLSYSLEVLTRDKDWLFTLILLLLANVNANGRSCEFLNWSLPSSYLKNCKEEAGGLLLSSLSSVQFSRSVMTL